MKAQLLLFAACICLLFTNCQHDNFDEPKATLSGTVVYNGNPVGVRTNGTQLELWQDGYDLYTKIAVHIAHDGTYSASLFDGDYKLVRLAGAPWEAQSSDTIYVKVKGHTTQDVTVIPYFIFKDFSFQRGSGTITATFNIEKIVESADLNSINLYLGKNLLTDQNQSEHIESMDLSQLNGNQGTITATIPDNLLNYDYIFVRLGIRSSQSNEYYYTQSEKFNLK